MIPAHLDNLPLSYLAKENPARTGCHWSAFVPATALFAAAEALHKAGYHIEDICGLDVAEGAVAVYHFDHFSEHCRIVLRVVAPHDKAEFPSIASVFQGAEWHERETSDFHGYRFIGNPNPVPLLLADDMAHVHPLKKAEGARVSLVTMLGAGDREVIRKDPAFTLMDAPVKEEAPKATPAVKPATKAEAKEGAPSESNAEDAVANKAVKKEKDNE